MTPALSPDAMIKSPKGPVGNTEIHYCIVIVCYGIIDNWQGDEKVQDVQDEDEGQKGC